MSEPRTSIRLKNVMVTFTGPARITKMERVGVIWTLVILVEIDVSLKPIQLYVVPLTLILPAQPITDVYNSRSSI